MKQLLTLTRNALVLAVLATLTNATPARAAQACVSASGGNCLVCESSTCSTVYCGFNGGTFLYCSWCTGQSPQGNGC